MGLFCTPGPTGSHCRSERVGSIDGIHQRIKQYCSADELTMMMSHTGGVSVSSVSLLSAESNTTAVSLPSVSRSVMSSPYTVLATGKPSDHAFVQLQPQPAHQVSFIPS